MFDVRNTMSAKKISIMIINADKIPAAYLQHSYVFF